MLNINGDDHRHHQQHQEGVPENKSLLTKRARNSDSDEPPVINEREAIASGTMLSRSRKYFKSGSHGEYQETLDWISRIESEYSDEGLYLEVLGAGKSKRALSIKCKGGIIRDTKDYNTWKMPLILGRQVIGEKRNRGESSGRYTITSVYDHQLGDLESKIRLIETNATLVMCPLLQVLKVKDSIERVSPCLRVHAIKNWNELSASTFGDFLDNDVVVVFDGLPLHDVYKTRVFPLGSYEGILNNKFPEHLDGLRDLPTDEIPDAMADTLKSTRAPALQHFKWRRAVILGCETMLGIPTTSRRCKYTSFDVFAHYKWLGISRPEVTNYAMAACNMVSFLSDTFVYFGDSIISGSRSNDRPRMHMQMEQLPYLIEAAKQSIFNEIVVEDYKLPILRETIFINLIPEEKLKYAVVGESRPSELKHLCESFLALPAMIRTSLDVSPKTILGGISLRLDRDIEALSAFSRSHLASAMRKLSESVTLQMRWLGSELLIPRHFFMKNKISAASVRFEYAQHTITALDIRSSLISFRVNPDSETEPHTDISIIAFAEIPNHFISYDQLMFLMKFERTTSIVTIDVIQQLNLHIIAALAYGDTEESRRGRQELYKDAINRVIQGFIPLLRESIEILEGIIAYSWDTHFFRGNKFGEVIPMCLDVLKNILEVPTIVGMIYLSNLMGKEKGGIPFLIQSLLRDLHKSKASFTESQPKLQEFFGCVPGRVSLSSDGTYDHIEESCKRCAFCNSECKAVVYVFQCGHICDQTCYIEHVGYCDCIPETTKIECPLCGIRTVQSFCFANYSSSFLDANYKVDGSSHTEPRTHKESEHTGPLRTLQDIGLSIPWSNKRRLFVGGTKVWAVSELLQRHHDKKVLVVTRGWNTSKAVVECVRGTHATARYYTNVQTFSKYVTAFNSSSEGVPKRGRCNALVIAAFYRTMGFTLTGVEKIIFTFDPTKELEQAILSHVRPSESIPALELCIILAQDTLETVLSDDMDDNEEWGLCEGVHLARNDPEDDGDVPA